MVMQDGGPGPLSRFVSGLTLFCSGLVRALFGRCSGIVRAMLFFSLFFFSLFFWP